MKETKLTLTFRVLLTYRNRDLFFDIETRSTSRSTETLRFRPSIELQSLNSVRPVVSLWG